MSFLDHQSTYIAFGGFIRKGREAKGLFQEDVAKALEIHPSMYGHIERGVRKVSLPMALNICRYLDLDLNDFIYTVDKKKPTIKRSVP